ncbi:MAG: hypothetical protein ABIP55_01380 [Tepidisphaeraceae bacterium]
MTARGEQSRNTRRRKGLALMLVVAVVAIASVLGFVMLSSASLQNTAGSNQVKLSGAEYAAESGINIAMYYLQYPDQAPSLNAGGYWPGTTTDLAMADRVTLSIGVTRDASNEKVYEVVTVATVGAVEGSRITKTSGVRLYVRQEFEVTKAAAFNFATQFSSGTTVEGDVYTNGNLALRTGVPLPAVNGVGYCRTSTTGASYVSPSGGFRFISVNAPGAPSVTAVSLYKTYKHGNVQYNCETINSGTIGGMTLNPAASNPGGIFYAASNLQLNDNLTINGTLVVEAGLNVRGANIVINPQPGYPALIVTGILDIDRTLKSLTVNGTCFVGTQIKASGSTPLPINLSTFTINGGLLVGQSGSSPIPTTGYNITTVLKFVKTKANPVALKTPRGVGILRWGLP